MRKLFFAVVALLFAACTTDVTEDVAVEAPETLRVSFEEDTRIQLMNGKTVWTKNDLVSVFYRSNAHDKYEFQGETGDADGSLKCISRGNPSVGLDKIVAVYPYSDKNLIELLTGNIQAFMPATQNYAKDSYGIGSSIMVSSSRTNTLYMKNVCGWLKVQLKGEGQVVNNIIIKGNNGEQVAGNVFITANTAECTLATALNGADGNNSGDLVGTLVDPTTILTKVTLDCGEGVTLGAEPTAFYIALPPQTFAKGLTVKVVCDDFSTMTKSTEKDVVISRNAIQPMAAVEVDVTPADPANNEIWYTATEKVEPYDNDEFGATITSNVWDSETCIGIITFNANVTKIGYKAFYNCKKLKTIIIPDRVTEIGNHAFSGCSSLTSVTIPDSVTKIEGNAFRDCSSLKDVYYTGDISAWCKISFESYDAHPLYYGAKLYIDNKEVTEVTIPSDVTEIKGYAFYKCSSLASVTIPDSVTTIGGSAFSNCTSLASISIPDSVSKIGQWAFYNCIGLTSVTIGNGVTTIGNYAFDGCSNLTSVTIGNRVTEIGYYAFYNCSSLTSITIPDRVTEIRGGAFEGCSSLKSVYCNAAYPPTLALGSSAFVNTALENIYVYAESVDTYKAKWSDYADKIVSNNKSNSDSITFTYTSTDGKAINESNLNLVVKSNSYTNGVGTLVVYGTAIPDKAFYQCTTLKTITIPNSVSSIGDYAFYKCSSLTSVTIPNSVSSIGDYAFSGCSSLTSVTIPNSVSSIEVYAFYKCSSLTSITIPDSVTTIGSRAFYGCTSLKEVYCKPTTPPAGDSDMFDNNASGRKIYVPASDDDSIINAYKAAEYWSDYAADIEEYNFTE